MMINNHLFRKIPIIIFKNDVNNIKGYRAEIADTWMEYKSSIYDNINFEDLAFHFEHNVDTHEKDRYVFYTRKDAVECAKYVNEKYLNNKAKIWLIHK